jgi:APA family basic amino acid/polyamine antiporter
MFAYSGWNASTYITGEVRNPSRNIPLSLGLGTVLVTALYIGVNAAFMRTTPIDEMVGKQQVALVAGTHIFGPAGRKIMALLICLGLVSTVSAMMWIGPRVTATDGRRLQHAQLAGAQKQPRNSGECDADTVRRSERDAADGHISDGGELRAVRASPFAPRSRSQGVFVLRWRRPDLPRPYRVWGYPVTPLIFLTIEGG